MTSQLKQLKECPETVSEDLSPKTDPDDSSEVSNFDENENEQVSKKEFGKDTGENEPIVNFSDNEGPVADSDKFQQLGTNSELRGNAGLISYQGVTSYINRNQQGAPEICIKQQAKTDINRCQQGAPGISKEQQANQSPDNKQQATAYCNKCQQGAPGISNEHLANESTSNTQLVNAGRNRGLQGAPEISNEQQTNADSNMGQQDSPGNSNEHLTNQIIDNQSQANEKNSGQHGAPGISDGQQTNQSTDNEFQVADSNRGQQGSPGISNEHQDNQGTNFDEQADPCNNTHQGNSATARDEALRRSTRVTDEELTKKFRLVQDERNYKASSTGGKGFGPQGQIIEGKTIMTRRINKIPSYNGDKWRYVIAMNCRRGSNPIENVFKKINQLISEGNRNRLAFVLGINEKVTLEQPLSYRPEWRDLVTEDEKKLLKATKIPILLVYYQWTTFRDVEDQKLNAYQVREQMFVSADLHPQILEKWVKENTEAKHEFPFGPAREILLNNDATKNFLKSLEKRNTPVYIHVQDSDVVSYQETLMFTDFQSKEVAPLITDSVKCLLDKFDILIDFKRSQNGFLPIFVGGAHVYSPDEDLSELGITSDAAKNLTRLGTEMSNFVRYFLQYSPTPFTKLF